MNERGATALAVQQPALAWNLLMTGQIASGRPGGLDAHDFSFPQRPIVMKHKTSQALYAYWNEIRGQRIAPRRFEIEPSRISSILPDTFILDCGEPGQYRFRLAGTRMSGMLGRDIRDSDFLDLFRTGDRRALSHILQQAIDRAPVSVLTAAPSPGDEGAISDPPRPATPRIEIVLLPLFHTQNAVTRLLGSAVPLDPHIASRHAMPFTQALAGHETIWPDGRPHAILEHMNRQSPFAPQQQLGRIVSSDRRRFRVFDGGKSP